jgi:hypothetical protein
MCKAPELPAELVRVPGARRKGFENFSFAHGTMYDAQEGNKVYSLQTYSSPLTVVFLNNFEHTLPQPLAM